MALAVVESKCRMRKAGCPSDGVVYDGLTTLARIAAFPGAWPVLSEWTRRCRMRRFLYGLIYHI